MVRDGVEGGKEKGERDNGDKRRLGNWGDLGGITSCSRKYIVSSFQEKSRLLLFLRLHGFPYRYP
jgi:hypothetical protein